MNTRQELRYLKERVDALERLTDQLIEHFFPGMLELATVEAFGWALMDELKNVPPDERAMTDEQLESAARRFAMRLRAMGEVPEKWSTILGRALLSTQGSSDA